MEQAGSLAGFLAVIGLAVLSALYFSQARDLRRLREWAGRAPERAAETGGVPQQPGQVPGRVVATPQRPPQPTAPGAAQAAMPAAAGAAAAQAAQGAPAKPQPQPAPANGAATNGDSAPTVAATGPAAAAKQAEEGAKKEEEAPDAEGSDKAAEAAEDAEKPAEASTPGMPAPASAAAAGAAAAAGSAAAASAGAGSASVTGPAAGPPAAPGAPPRPAGPHAPPTPAKPAPQRPPGSVLPPRTGTLPPVRRLPSSNVGGGPAAEQTGILGQAPQPKKRNPLYVVLAVAGVLVIGAAAAIGVPAIVNGTKNKNSSNSKKASSTTTHRASARTLSPGDITVAVLNGTSVNGLAGQVGDRVEADGFKKGTVSNASLTNGQRANSVVMYTRGHEREAALVARRLRIHNIQAADSSSEQIAGNAQVIVLVGADKAQG